MATSARNDRPLIQRIFSAIGRGLLAVFALIGRGFRALAWGFWKLAQRSRLAATLIVIVLVVVIVGLADFGINAGKAYPGVHVGEIDVSGKTTEEITELVQNEYETRVANGSIEVFSSQADQEMVESGNYNPDEGEITYWSATASTLGAFVPAEKLAEEAVQVGRENGGVPARLGAAFQGWDIEVSVSYDEEALENFAEGIDEVLGDPRIDYNIEVTNGVASVTEGKDGEMVDRTELEDEISTIFLSPTGTGSFVTHVEDAPVRINKAKALAVSVDVNNAIADGAVFTLGDESTSVDAVTLGSWIVTDIEKQGDDYALVPSIDEIKARATILSLAKSELDLSTLVVRFTKSDDGSILVNASGVGEVPSATDTSKALTKALFGTGGKAEEMRIEMENSAESEEKGDAEEAFDVDDAQAEDQTADDASEVSDQELGETPTVIGDEPVKVEVSLGPLPPEITFDEALDLGVVEEFSEYTTEFSTGDGTANRRKNIELLTKYISDSIVDPGDTWSFNAVAGERTEDRGFQLAGAVEGDEHIDEIGGGVCQVATTVFNAVFEAGLPIDERHNHSLYIDSYPDGRDAAVSWPDVDLRWENDTPSSILLRADYSDGYVTVKLYGVDPGYVVESETGEWIEGEKYTTKYEVDDSLSSGEKVTDTAGVDGSEITVTRTVKDADGNVIREAEFHSVYSPVTEVIKISE